MSHIASYHYYYSFAKIHSYQSYFNMSSHWHMNISYLVKFHVDMMTLFKKSLTKEQMSM
jgi:hypothetical protein